MLDRRQLCGDGFYIAAAHDALETLAYHALVHRRAPSELHKERLASLARSQNRPEWTRAALDDPASLKGLLDGALAAQGYAYVRPRDRLVFDNFHAAGARWPDARCALAHVQACFVRRYHLWSAAARAHYFARRDLLARTAPWARKLLRPGRRPRPGFEAPAVSDLAKAGPAAPAAADDLR